MKKMYLFAALLFGSSFSFAQDSQSAIKESIQLPSESTIDNQTSPSFGNRNIIWEDDFSVPSDWQITTTGQGTWETVTTTPAQLVTYMGSMASTSAANGFAVFNGSQYLVSGTVDPQNTSIEPVSDIDLSTYPAVILSFEQRYRAFNSDRTIIELSSDGGTTWVEIEINQEIVVNTPSVQSTVNLNVTPYIGGSANARIRFTWLNESDDNQFGSGYGWMVDDVKIAEAPDNDIVLERAYILWEGKEGFYNNIPIVQSNPATFESAVHNYGTATQTDVKLEVDIEHSSSGALYNQTGPGKDLATLLRDTLELFTPTFTPAQEGLCTVTFHAYQTETEESPANNTKTLSFNITDTVYARDHGVTTNVPALGPSSFSFAGAQANVDGSMLGTTYDFTTKAEMSSMSVFIHNTTAIGTSIVGHVFEYNPIDGIVGNSILETDIYDIEDNSNKNKWVTLNFNNKDGVAEFIDAGTSVLVAIEVFGVSAANTEFVFVGNDQTTYHGNYVVSYIYIPASTQWAPILPTPFIRLNVASGYVGLNESSKTNSSIKLFQNEPNPANGSTIIRYELPEEANVTLKVFNITGKEVLVINEGNKRAGAHKLNLNTADLSGGVYYYTLTTGNAEATQKMIIIE